METAQHLLVYDKDCPFCNWYTGVFIRNGLMKRSERTPYETAVADPSLHFNHDDARNRIAWLDTQNNTALYGIDSLLAILGRKWPLIHRIGHLFLIHWLLEQLYSFISYNRKIFAPAYQKVTCACHPATSWFWRVVLMVLCGWSVHAAAQLYFNQHLSNYLISNDLNNLIYFLLQLIIQGSLFSLLGNKNLYDYLGHLSFVSFIGSFLLIISHFSLIFLQQYNMDISLLQPLLFGVVMTTLFFMHKRRLQLLQASSLLSFTWVLFRISIAPFTFNLFAV